MLIDNPKGGFSFVKGIGPFSSGAVANAGFEIVHAVAVPLIKLDDGYGVIERHLREADRPMNAVCGMELRIPKPLTPAGFNEFNRGYLKRLAAWDVQVDGNNPIARTNVAIEISPIAEPALFGFYYTVPSSTKSRTFVLAGAGELEVDEPRQSRGCRGHRCVAFGPHAEDEIRAGSARRASRRKMKMTWSDATAVNFSTRCTMRNDVMALTILPALGTAAHRGVTWQYTRPPIDVMQLEIDAAAVMREIVFSRGYSAVLYLAHMIGRGGLA